MTPPLCECGCGQPTKPYSPASKRRGYTRYLNGHQHHSQRPEPSAHALALRNSEHHQREAALVADLAEDAQDLLNAYESAWSIAYRFGYKNPSSLGRRLRRWGYTDLACVFERADRGDRETDWTAA